MALFDPRVESESECIRFRQSGFIAALEWVAFALIILVVVVSFDAGWFAAFGIPFGLVGMVMTFQVARSSVLVDRTGIRVAFYRTRFVPAASIDSLTLEHAGNQTRAIETIQYVTPSGKRVPMRPTAARCTPRRTRQIEQDLHTMQRLLGLPQTLVREPAPRYRWS